jgi:hypothetical protein
LSRSKRSRECSPGQLPNSDEWPGCSRFGRDDRCAHARGEGYIGGQANESFLERIQTIDGECVARTTREGVGVYAAFYRSMYGWTAVVVVPRANLGRPLFASMTGVFGGGLVLVICGLIAVLSVIAALVGRS